MPRPALIALAVAAVAGLCACVAAAAPPPPAALGPTRADVGHGLAQRLCAGCHQVERTGDSPNSASPPFKVLADRYNQVTLGRKLDDIATGHYQMPPTHVTNDEIDSLVEYLDSFRDDWAAPER
jgi:mono/diheme cytochrome c family protein